MPVMICDLETESHKYFNDVASPFHPDNYIVAPAYAIDDGPVKHWYFGSREEADASDWLRELDQCDGFVAHNAQFEICWLLSRHRKTFEDFLKRGGRVYCTQLAEYILSAQTHMYPTLEETAVAHGGTTKVDGVKILWEQGVLTSQIDRELLLRYLVGPDGDIENTRISFFDQVELLMKSGQWEHYCMRCDALLYSAYCKFFGMYVDRERADADGEALRQKILELEPQLVQYLPGDMPQELRDQFNWGSDFHLSALMFGGPIKYKKQVSYDPPKYEKVDCVQCIDGRFIPLDDAGDFRGELVLYKSGKNKGQAKVFQVDSSTEKMKWGEGIYICKPIVDLEALPMAVSSDFLSKRGQFRGKRYLCDAVYEGDRVVSGTPVYSTGKDALEAVAPFAGNDLPKLLLELADSQKIYGTYYVGMLGDVDDENILRRGINHVSTITGRLSSGLQQMPRGGTVKSMFVSRFKDGKIIDNDYTALEVVHLATLSGDRALLGYLQAGTDMHCLRLSADIGRDYSELVRINDDEDDPEHAEIHELRQQIKPKSFQYQYGGTAEGIAFKTGCTVEEAQRFIDNELLLFPESSAFRFVIQAAVEKDAETRGYRREVNDKGAWQVYKEGIYTGPSGTRYRFRQYPKSMRDAEGHFVQTMQFRLPQLANYPNQGEASLVTQTATGLVIRWLLKNDFFGDKVLPICTVHDAIYTDVHPDFVEIAGAGVKRWMEYAPKYMAELFPAYRELGIQDIPYPAVPEVGDHM